MNEKSKGLILIHTFYTPGHSRFYRDKSSCLGDILQWRSRSRIHKSWISALSMSYYLLLGLHEGERARFVFNGLRWIQGSIRVWIPQPCDTTPLTLTKEFSIPVSTFVPQAKSYLVSVLPKNPRTFSYHGTNWLLFSSKREYTNTHVLKELCVTGKTQGAISQHRSRPWLIVCTGSCWRLFV